MIALKSQNKAMFQLPTMSIISHLFSYTTVILVASVATLNFGFMSLTSPSKDETRMALLHFIGFQLYFCFGSKNMYLIENSLI